MVVSYECKKWTLFSLSLVGIVITIIVVAVACHQIDHTDPPAGTSEEAKKLWPDVQKIAKGIVIAIGVINILFELTGVCGSYKEHYCMTLTYAILMTLATLGAIGSATRPGGASNWGVFVVDLLITILAYIFARDIKEKQRSGGQGYHA